MKALASRQLLETPVVKREAFLEHLLSRGSFDQASAYLSCRGSGPMQGGLQDALHCFQLACIQHAYIKVVIC